MALAGLLLLFVIVFGPTMAIFSDLFSSTVAYFKDLVPLSNWVGREGTDFVHGWTTFYWVWWISWSPFVGMFIARVLRGRTVREFILCVLIVLLLVGILWMAAFGGTAIDQHVTGGYAGVVDTVTNWTPELSLCKMLEVLPLPAVSSFLGIVLVIVFFVTSSESGSLVIDTITAGGRPMHRSPSACSGLPPKASSPSPCCWAAGSPPCRRRRSRPASPSPWC